MSFSATQIYKGGKGTTERIIYMRTINFKEGFIFHRLCRKYNQIFESQQKTTEIQIPLECGDRWSPSVAMA